MAQPPAYTPADFTSKEFNENRLADLDSEHAKIQAFADVVVTNLAILQRDDTKLANGIVHKDAIGPETLALFAAAWNPRGAWATATEYAKLDAVNEGDKLYICVEAHISGTFSTDLAAEKWLFAGSENVYATDADIAAAYAAEVSAATESEMINGTETAIRRLSPLRVWQAIRAHAPAVVAATDTGTDVYQANVGGDLNSGNVVELDIDSANTTASPTLENIGGSPAGAQSIVTTEGVGFIGMLEARPHRFQWDGTNYVVLDPAGGVVDRGTGSNGEYIRWASGEQWCLHTISETVDINNAGGGVNWSGETTWTFPKAFTAIGEYEASVQERNSSAVWAQLSKKGLSSLGYRYMRVSADTAVSVTSSLMAMGRWK